MVFLLSSQSAAGNSFKCRSIIAQGAQELHPRSDGGIHVHGQDSFVGVMTQSSGAAQEEDCRGYSSGNDHCIVASAAGDGSGFMAGSAVRSGAEQIR